MIWVDFVIVGIIALSAVISLVRGFVREAVSLAGWIVAVWLSITYMDDVALYLQPYICLLYTSPSPRDKRQSRMPSSA